MENFLVEYAVLADLAKTRLYKYLYFLVLLNDHVVLSNLIFVSTNNRLASSSNSSYLELATVIQW